MTLQSSGPISIAQVCAEFGFSLPQQLGSTQMRAKAGKPSGPISLHDFYGLSNFAMGALGIAVAETYPSGGSGTAYATVTAGSGTLLFTPSMNSFGGDPGASAALYKNGGGVGTLAQIQSDGFAYYLALTPQSVSVTAGDVISIQAYGPGYYSVLNINIAVTLAGSLLQTAQAAVIY